jgi:hypothetical protein
MIFWGVDFLQNGFMNIFFEINTVDSESITQKEVLSHFTHSSNFPVHTQSRNHQTPGGLGTFHSTMRVGGSCHGGCEAIPRRARI